MALTKVTYSMVGGASLNVKDFGAVGDNATDDSAAFAAACAEANSSGKSIYVPKGVYRVAPNNIIITADRVGIFSDSNNAMLRCLTDDAANYVVKFTGATKENFLKNLRIFGNTGTDRADTSGIFSDSPTFYMENCSIEDFKNTGLYLDDSFIGVISNCIFLGCYRGAIVNGSARFVNGTSFTYCTVGCYVETGNPSFESCFIESNNVTPSEFGRTFTPATDLIGGVYTERPLSIDGLTYFENNGARSNVRVAGNAFSQSRFYDFAVYAKNTRGVFVKGRYNANPGGFRFDNSYGCKVEGVLFSTANRAITPSPYIWGKNGSYDISSNIVPDLETGSAFPSQTMFCLGLNNKSDFSGVGSDLKTLTDTVFDGATTAPAIIGNWSTELTLGDNITGTLSGSPPSEVVGDMSGAVHTASSKSIYIEKVGRGEVVQASSWIRVPNSADAKLFCYVRNVTAGTDTFIFTGMTGADFSGNVEKINFITRLPNDGNTYRFGFSFDLFAYSGAERSEIGNPQIVFSSNTGFVF